MADRRRLVAIVAALFGAAALVAPADWRMELLAVLVLVAPGTAVVRLIALPPGLTSLIVMVATGLALTEAVALLLMYAHAWSWAAVVGVLMAFTLALVALPAPEPPRWTELHR